MTDWRHVTTERLWLDEPAPGDEDALFAIHSDPESWVHFPQGLHTDRSKTPGMISGSRAAFAEVGLGYWSVRDVASGPVIGWGGCDIRSNGTPGRWFNLAYRFDQSVLRRGYATELGRTAVAAAHDVLPDVPVVAYLLEHNEGSRRTAERLGLQLCWRGPDEGNDDPEAIRLVFVDREPTEVLRRVLVEKGMGLEGWLD